MHVSLTRVKTSEQPLEAATIVAEEMERWLRDIDGFDGMMMLYGEGTTIGLTFWESREIAESQRPLRMQFLERMTAVAEVEIEAIEDYELAFASLGSLGD